MSLAVDKNTKFDRRRLPPTFLSVQLTKSSVSFITQEQCVCRIRIRYISYTAKKKCRKF
jgi:hypothetical protein